MNAPTKQYTQAAEIRRSQLARKLNELYGFTPSELIRLTGMKLRDLPTWQEEQLIEAYMEGCVS